MQILLSRSISVSYIGGGMHIAGRYDTVWRWALVCGMKVWAGVAKEAEDTTNQWLERCAHNPWHST
jgi:hypothetical protein